MPFDSNPDLWTKEQRRQLGKMCRRAYQMLEVGGVTFGQALTRAAAQVDITLTPQMESAVLVTLFRVSAAGGVEQAARSVGALLEQDKN